MLIKFIPNYYVKDLFNYDFSIFLKDKINTILIDLDNTITFHDQIHMKQCEKQLLDNLQKNFKVIIISNNTKLRVETWLGNYKIEFVANAKKPSKKILTTVIENHNLDKDKIIMIGDQVLTDVFGANRIGVKSVLVEQKASNDLHFTKINRFFERIILKILAKQKKFSKEDSKWK